MVSPARFRKWAAIHAIGAAVERRVWSKFNINRMYPNLFVFLVGPPGTGKTQAMKPMFHILRKADAVKLAPNDVSKQSLLDAMAENTKVFFEKGLPVDYHYLDLMITELSNFMSEYDGALAGLLTQLFDCEDSNEERKRTTKGSGMIINPGLAMLAGTATKNLGKTISGDLWGQGFMARVLLVHSAEIVPFDPFVETEYDADLERELIEAFARLGEMSGQMTWHDDARAAFVAYKDAHFAPVPTHNKLIEYNTRRWMHAAKLAMIAALSDERQIIYAEDVHMAVEWLLELEAEIPEIFKDMISGGDGEIMADTHNQLVQFWINNGKRAIPVSFIYRLLSKQVAAHSIERVIQVMENAGMISRMAGTQGADAYYVPKMGGGLTAGVA